MTRTIFGQSSAYGKAGIAIYRISGPKALQVAEIITRHKSFESRRAYLLDILDHNSGELIDKGLIIYFKAPHSFTGEDVVELHLHGSIAISKIMFDLLGKIKFINIAEPGEFSKRAFLNGKLDLIQAEGLVDLINAETTMQHKQAISQTTGKLSELYEVWRKRLVKLMSYIEAFIDFPEEEIPSEISAEIKKDVNDLIDQMSSHLKDNRRGEVIRSGITLSIFGPPNVGKSSLINYISNKEVAIVSDAPGTTRDLLETFIDLEGYPIYLTDTAGIHANTQEQVELEGIRRAINKTTQSHIKILVVDVMTDLQNLDAKIGSLIDDKTIVVINKIDLDINYNTHHVKAIPISLKQNLNLDQLIQKIVKEIEKIIGTLENPCITRVRHRKNITESLESLLDFSMDKDLVLGAEDLRLASRHLSLIVGKITVDEILGEIFSSFCIGK